MSQLVLTGGDSAQVFEARKEVLHARALAITDPTVSARLEAMGARGNARSHPPGQPPCAEGITRATLVGDEPGAGDCLCQSLRMGKVGVVAGTQAQANGLPGLIDERTDLAVQAALGAPQRRPSRSARGRAGAPRPLHMGRVEEAPRTLPRQFALGK